MSLASDSAWNSREYQSLRAGTTVLQNVTAKTPLFGIIMKIPAERESVMFILGEFRTQVTRKLAFLTEPALQSPLKRKSVFQR